MRACNRPHDECEAKGRDGVEEELEPEIPHGDRLVEEARRRGQRDQPSDRPPPQRSTNGARLKNAHQTAIAAVPTKPPASATGRAIAPELTSGVPSQISARRSPATAPGHSRSCRPPWVWTVFMSSRTHRARDPFRCDAHVAGARRALRAGRRTDYLRPSLASRESPRPARPAWVPRTAGTVPATRRRPAGDPVSTA